MLEDLAPYKTLVCEHLEEMRLSDAFTRSARLFMLLEFLVNETISGRGDTLKELVIGHALYSRAGPYDPAIDSSVRVEVRRLRHKLRTYYEGSGRRSPIRILLPENGYRPYIAPHHACGASAPPAGDPSDPSLVDLAVMPFRALAAGDEYGEFADGLTDEIIYVFERESQLKVAPRLVVFQFKSRCYGLQEAIQVIGARALLHGTLRFSGCCARVTTEISDDLGFTLWSSRFDFPFENIFARQEELAREVFDRAPIHLARLTKRPVTDAFCLDR